MIRAVLDTNVLASAVVGSQKYPSTSADLLLRWENLTYELVVSQTILDELARTLLKPYFQRLVTADERQHVLFILRHQAIMIPITAFVRGVASHPEDDLILATAVSGTVDYLVTGDRALQALGSYRGVDIVSPIQFLGALDTS